MEATAKKAIKPPRSSGKLLEEVSVAKPAAMIKSRVKRSLSISPEG